MSIRLSKSMTGKGVALFSVDRNGMVVSPLTLDLSTGDAEAVDNAQEENGEGQDKGHKKGSGDTAS